mgnify:CR=1 FL=1
MARFLNINATYNPLTMDEMLKVPLLYDAAYKEAEKNIDEYNDKVEKTDEDKVIRYTDLTGILSVEKRFSMIQKIARQ